MAGDVPEGWEAVEVGEAIAMLPGFAFKPDHLVTATTDGLPLIRSRDLGRAVTSARYVGQYDETFAVADGDVLVGMDGEFPGVRWQGGKALLNQRVLKLWSAQRDRLDDRFLFYRVQPALRELEQSDSGTAGKHLSTEDLKRLVWQLPPLDEQRRIADLLESVDQAIAAAAEVARQWETAFARLLDAAFIEGQPSSLDDLFSLIYRHSGSYGFDQLEEAPATEATAQAVAALRQLRQTKAMLMSDLLSGRVRVPG